MTGSTYTGICTDTCPLFSHCQKIFQALDGEYDEILKILAVEEDVLLSKPPLGLELIVSSDEDHRPKRFVVVVVTRERNTTGETYSPTYLVHQN
jgi:hypothetical protein